MSQRTALVIGATGLVGRELVKQLLEGQEYERVYVWVRTSLGLSHNKLIEMSVDFRKIVEMSGQAASNPTPFPDGGNADDLFCCLGTTIRVAGSQEQFKFVDVDLPVAVAKLCRQHGTQRMFIISAVGSSEKSSVFYSRMKGLVERLVSEIGFSKLHIFRPSLLLGVRAEFRLGEKIAIILSPLYSFALIGPLRRYRPIRAEQVARAMLVAAQTVETKNGATAAVTVWENEQMLDASR